MRNIIFNLLTLIVLTGCRYGEATYETFKYNRNWNMQHVDIPKIIPQYREIYSEDKYIYIFRNSHKGCVYGYLTNRDDKPEKVIGWIIISGKEFCKEQKNFTFQI
ncbi:MAG: hypothetical protein GX118_06245 [Arcobacter butzleri]|nr:hypothetical protein [Aliarcobacter butzleri]